MPAMRRFSLVLVVLAVGSAHCGGAVAPSDETEPKASHTAWSVTASCAEVKASCVSAPATFVHGHATGLAALDGARAEFAVRYILTEGSGLDVPHGVVVGRTHVKDGAFEACVCVPHGANMYPQIASVVYHPQTTGGTSRDVARATFSQRYATLGDEDLSYALNAVPSELQKEAAVAAMIERTASTIVGNLRSFEGSRVIAGLVSDDRPVAAQIARESVENGKVAITWTMPGHASPSERVVFFIDGNNNGLCDTDGSDVGGVTSFGGNIDFTSSWLANAELSPVCDALQPSASRE
jgi:hypothetical protein